MIQIACLALIKNVKNNYLMVKQIKDFGSVYFFPGGKIDENESCRECLKRELLEELAITVDVGDIVAFSETSYDKKDMLNLYYEAKIITGTPTVKESTKITEVVYLPIKNVFNLSKIKFINK